MTLPYWWGDGVRVVTEGGHPGTLTLTSAGWAVHLDGESALALTTDPSVFQPEVRQTLTEGQYQRIVYDAERALVRAFGCSYVPEWEALADRLRTSTYRPEVRNRPGLDGLRAIVRGAVKEALAKYVEG